ncbi:MAG: flippase-like domain-containing protein [Bacteroidia bacterium]|nr:flippase-like domain-containing protein [Bacteroidia bacterium]
MSGSLVFFIFKWKSKNTEEFKAHLKEWIVGNYLHCLFILLLLMLLNWVLEAWKWKILTRKLCPEGFGTCFMNVWSGLFVGSFSPGRALEFAGRIYFHPPLYWPELALRYFISSFMQFLITVFWGVCLWPFLPGIGITEPYMVSVVMFFIFIVFLYSMIHFFLINQPRWEFFLRKKTEFFLKWPPLNENLPVLEKKEMWTILTLSLLRYIVFSFQLFLVLYHMNTKTLGFASLISFISVYYLLTGVVPMISLFEIPVRSWIAAVLLGPSEISWLTVSFAVSWVWIINLFLPSFVGMLFFVFRFNPNQWKLFMSERNKP